MFDIPAAQAILTTDVRSPAKHQTDSTQTSLDPRGAHGGVQREAPQALPKKTKMSNEQKPLRERLHSPEQEISQSQTSSTQWSFAGESEGNPLRPKKGGEADRVKKRLREERGWKGGGGETERKCSCEPQLIGSRAAVGGRSWRWFCQQIQLWSFINTELPEH